MSGHSPMPLDDDDEFISPELAGTGAVLAARAPGVAGAPRRPGVHGGAGADGDGREPDHADPRAADLRPRLRRRVPSRLRVRRVRRGIRDRRGRVPGRPHVGAPAGREVRAGAREPARADVRAHPRAVDRRADEGEARRVRLAGDGRRRLARRISPSGAASRGSCPSRRSSARSR